MANATPVKFTNRPGKEGSWYGSEAEQPGLSPVKLKVPVNPTIIERKTCECGASYMLSDVEPEVTCECGQVVKLL